MKEVISAKQFAILVFMNTLGTAVVFIPTIATRYGGENGWVTLILSSIAGLATIFIYIKILDNNNQLNFFQIIEDLVGQLIAKVIFVLMFLFTYISAIGNVWALSQFISLQILMETPAEIIALITLLSSLIAVRYGIESISRACEIFFPFTIVSLVLLTLFVLPEARMENIQPIMQFQQAGTFVGVIPVLAITFLELFYMLVICTSVNNRKAAKKAFFIGGLLAGFSMTIVTLACIAVLGVGGTLRHTYPIYVLGQNIRFANFFERIEVLVAFIWFSTIFFKVCTSIYFLNRTGQHLFNFKSYKVITIPLTIFAFASAITNFLSVLSDLKLINSTYVVFALFIGLIIPFILAVVRVFKKT